jgi:hypothetical protein
MLKQSKEGNIMDQERQEKPSQTVTSLLLFSRRKFLHWTAALGFSAGAVGIWLSRQENASASPGDERVPAQASFALANVAGHWPFDEGVGTTTADTSGNRHRGTLSRGVKWVTGGATQTAAARARDHALHFNGKSGAIEIDASVLNTSMSYSLSAWVLLDTTANWSTAVSQDSDVHSGFFLQLTAPSQGNTFSFSLINANVPGASTTHAFAPFQSLTGIWYHLVGSYDATLQQISLYINGSLVDQQSVPAAWAAKGHTIVGRGKVNGKLTDYWPGQIDDVQAYQRVLAASDVETLYGSSNRNHLNKDALLSYYSGLYANTPYPQSFADPQWFKENIPFLDCPDSAIQDVYYYRWSAYKRHLRYTVPGVGYILTEFLANIDYAGLYSSINAAAGHHIYEGRWLHNQRYLNDYQNFWLNGADSRIQPREYSFWIADAYYARYLVNADQPFLTSFLNQLDANYQAWATPSNYNNTTGRYGTGYDANVGLYYQTPVWDAMEFSLSSYQDPVDPYHGGEGYRPTINAYMYGDAQAIAHIAQLAGNHSLATAYLHRAATLKKTMQSKLWNKSLDFFVPFFRSSQVFDGRGLFDGREEIGYIPWYFNMPDPQYSIAWSYLMNPAHFYTAYGPTTGDQSYVASINANGFSVGQNLFMYQAGGCCRWDGPSWPFSTSQTLTAMANVLNNQSHYRAPISASDYYTSLRNYALTQYKDGYPYVAEAHSPTAATWIYDGTNRSEHYNHSTYNDLVITGLVGLRPRADAVLEVNPLVPSHGSNAWSYFCLEDVLYHGHLITILYDRDGTRYGHGAGFQIYVDGALASLSPTIRRVTVKLPSSQPIVHQTRFENYASNNVSPGTTTAYSTPQASYTFSASDSSLGAAFDGIINYDRTNPTRWSNYQSGNSTDWLQVSFPASKTINSATIYFYSDTDNPGTKAPKDYTIQWWNGSTWNTASHQVKAPATPTGNAMNTVRFDTITTTQLRLIVTNALPASVGIVEFEVWSLPS